MNISDILNNVDQYQTEGNDLSALVAALQTKLSTPKTPLGLNQWQPDDKPRMEHFNEDNRRIDELIREVREEVANKANMGSPKRYNIEFLSPFSKAGAHAAIYTKTTDNLVIVNLSVTNESGVIGVGVFDIAVLPAGFRPVAHTIVCPSSAGEPKASYIGFYTDGSIRLKVMENVGAVYANAVFPAQ